MDGARSRAVGVLEVVQTVREMAVAAVIATIAGFLQVAPLPRTAEAWLKSAVSTQWASAAGMASVAGWLEQHQQDGLWSLWLPACQPWWQTLFATNSQHVSTTSHAPGHSPP